MWFKVIQSLTGLAQVGIGYAVWSNRSATKAIVSKLDEVNKTVKKEAKRFTPPAPTTAASRRTETISGDAAEQGGKT